MRSISEPMEPVWDGVGDVPGGAMLRELRQAEGLSLADLAGRLADGGYSIDQSHLQKIEAGRIARPTADTIDAILSAGLDVPFRTRREVLAAFGYRLPWALPQGEEIEEGRRISVHELRSATWPAYLMDHGQRLWTWNRYVSRLLGLPPDDPAPSRFVGLTTLELVFNPAIGVNLMIANLDLYRPLFVHMFKVQTQSYRHEPWLHELIARGRQWPGFSPLWDALPDDPDDILHDQPIHPIEFAVPGLAQPLRFRIASIYLALDPRFQVVHWIPYGAACLHQCALWAEADGEP